MTDREMLENAAKAAGIDIKHWIPNEPFSREWNPLTNDGDAFRLAVKLKLKVGSDGQSVHEQIRCWLSNHYAPDVYELVGDDPLAATRRAIVRAAAEIGRGKE